MWNFIKSWFPFLNGNAGPRELEEIIRKRRGEEPPLTITPDSLNEFNELLIRAKAHGVVELDITYDIQSLKFTGGYPAETPPRMKEEYIRQYLSEKGFKTRRGEEFPRMFQSFYVRLS
jgi:hypothetical protein